MSDVNKSEMSSGNSDQVILATGGYDHTIKVWQVNTGVCKYTGQHTDSQVNALAITPDKYHIAAAGTVCEWKEGARSSVLLRRIMELLKKNGVSNTTQLVNEGHQHIRLYDITSSNPNPVINYEGVSKNVTGIGFQEDGQWMYTGGEDFNARIWDLRTKNLQCQKMYQMNAPINCLVLHPNQCELIVGDQSGVINIWDLKTDRNEQLIPEAEASIQSLSIDAGGHLMAAVNNKGSCYIWSLTSIKDEPTKLNPRHKIQAHCRYVLKCVLSSDAKLLVTCSADQTARVWDTETFNLVQELKHDLQRWVWDAAFSADSKYVVTASSDHVARLWNVETGAIEREYSGHQKAVTALAYCDTPAKVNPVP